MSYLGGARPAFPMRTIPSAPIKKRFTDFRTLFWRIGYYISGFWIRKKTQKTAPYTKKFF
jgi:hypothetical protein